jgi:hypothetical protein
MGVAVDLRVMTTRRILVGVVLGAALVGACGGDDEPAAESSSTTPTTMESSTTVSESTVAEPTTSTAVSTTVSSETTVAGEWADFPCGGQPNLADALMTYANENSPTPGIEFMVTDVVIADADPTWGRGTVAVPPDAGLEGFIAVAHCEGDPGSDSWQITDVGTSGVGCAGDVPAELGVEC